MIKNTYLVLIFVLSMLLQTGVMVFMVYKNVVIMDRGIEYKFKLKSSVHVNTTFKTFNGTYMYLNFNDRVFSIEQDRVVSPNKFSEEDRDNVVYVYYGIGEDGFAYIDTISKTRQSDEAVFLKTKIDYFEDDMIYIEFPFDKFYINEKKAEKIITFLDEEDNDVYVVIAFQNGKGVVKNIYVNDTASIEDIIKR